MEGSLLRQSQQIGPIRGFSKSQSQRTQRAGIAKATSPSSPFLRASVTHPDFPSKTMIRANDAPRRRTTFICGAVCEEIPAGSVSQKSLDFKEWTKSAKVGSPGPVSVPLQRLEPRRSIACTCRTELAIPRISCYRNCKHNRSSAHRPRQEPFCSWQRLLASLLCSPVSVRYKHGAPEDY